MSTPGTTPTRFGKYEVLAEIARGGMGVVYKARDPFIDRVLAIKTLLPDAEVSEQLRRRMVVEARAAGNLRHANIVTIYDLGVIDGRPFIAMEYLDGMDLGRVIRKHPRVLLGNKLRLVATVAAALEFAHRHNVVHRDIKPSNIFVLSTGLVKVVDFGIARFADHTMTGTGQVLGTMAYMAPEQLEAKPIDRRADVYALGVVLYELLSGRRPFHSDVLPTLIYQILNQKQEPCPGLPAGLAPGIDAILARALAKKPDERYPGMGPFAEDLRRLLAEGRDAIAAHEAPARAEIESRVRRAHALVEEQKFEESVIAIREALALDPTHEETVGLAERIEEDRFRDLVRSELGRIRELVGRNELVNARRALRGILRRDSSVTDARQLLEEVEGRLKADGVLDLTGSALVGELPDADPLSAETSGGLADLAEELERPTELLTPSAPPLSSDAPARPRTGPALERALELARPAATEPPAHARRWPVPVAVAVIAALAAVVVTLLFQRPRPSPPAIVAATPAPIETAAAIPATVTPADVPPPGPAAVPGLEPSSTPAPPPAAAAALTPSVSPAARATAAPTAPAAASTPARPTPRAMPSVPAPPAATATPSAAAAAAARLQETLSQAEAAAGTRDWTALAAGYSSALALAPGEARAASWRQIVEAAELIAAADRAFAARSFAESARGYRDGLSRLRQARFDPESIAHVDSLRAMSEGEESLKAGQLAAARAAFAQVLEPELARRGARRLQVEQLRQQGQEALAREQLEPARQRFAELLEIEPGDLEARGRLQHIQQLLAATLEVAAAKEQERLRTAAEAAYQRGEFQAAADRLQELEAKAPGDAALKARRELFSSLARARTALEARDCARVTTLLAGSGDQAAKKMIEDCRLATLPRRGQTSADMVRIPAGSFDMGEDGGLPDMKPAHRVTLGEYLIDRHKVTNGQYAEHCRTTGRKPPAYWPDGEPPTGQLDHAVRQVTWADADAFCRHAGKRLPSEGEWERAARGPRDLDYPWGDGHDRKRYNSGGRTTPVGAFAASASGFGVIGLVDYVWEWTSSWYEAYPGNRQPDPGYGRQLKVVRGRLETKGDSVLSVGSRHALEPRTLDEHLGFRCAIGAAELAALSE